MCAAADEEDGLAPGVVIAQPWLIPVDLEFPEAFPDIASGECLGQTEARHNGSNS
jgi:hypothetical protein